MAACSNRDATLTGSPVTSASPVSGPATTSPVQMPSSPPDPEGIERPLEFEGGPKGAERIILVGQWDAEHRHHGIADELLDRAAVPFYGGPGPIEVPALVAPDGLGVAPLARRRRVDEVAEEHRDELAHLSIAHDGSVDPVRRDHDPLVALTA